MYVLITFPAYFSYSCMNIYFSELQGEPTIKYPTLHTYEIWKYKFK